MKAYINDLTDQDIAELMNRDDGDVFFKHKDTALFFKNSGNLFYAFDVEDENESIEVGRFFAETIQSHYADINELIRDFKRFENLSGREIVFVDEDTQGRLTLRQLELDCDRLLACRE